MSNKNYIIEKIKKSILNLENDYGFDIGELDYYFIDILNDINNLL